MLGNTNVESTPPRSRTPLNWIGISPVPRTEVQISSLVTPSGHGGNRILYSRLARAARSHSCHARVTCLLLHRFTESSTNSGRPGTRTLNGFLGRSCFQNSVLIQPDAFRCDPSVCFCADSCCLVGREGFEPPLPRMWRLFYRQPRHPDHDVPF